MPIPPRTLILLSLAGATLACGEFREQADSQFGDQNFKTAIALIELHRVRTGAFPNRLEDLRFSGQWEKMALSAVKYTRLPDGYELDIVRGWVGTPKLKYPDQFWQGLGLRRSNVLRGDDGAADDTKPDTLYDLPGTAAPGMKWVRSELFRFCEEPARPTPSGSIWVRPDSAIALAVARRFLAGRVTARHRAVKAYFHTSDGVLIQFADTLPGVIDGTASVYVSNGPCVAFLGW